MMRQFALLLSLSLIVVLVADSNKPINSAPESVPPPVVTGVEDSPVAGTPAKASAKPIWESAVFRVRQKNYSGINSGSAVSLGHGLMVTAYHVVAGSGPVQVCVQGRWIPANFNRVAGQDVAYLTVNDTTLPVVAVRDPVPGEVVHTYGMTTRWPWKGVIKGDRKARNGTWSVTIDDPSYEYTESGDSGGGLFAEDGSLVMVHSGRMSSQGESWTYGTPLNPPVPFSQEPKSTASTPEPQLIIFSASWCGPCHQYEATLKSLDWSDIQIVDIDTDAGKQVMQDLNCTVAKVPTTVLVEGGRIVKTQVGGMTAQQVKRFAGRE